ncbi:hypothetical protein MLD38_031500 [Melastoma candidum]|uniref:Uncharacterized protein n=1 Tax=Melastoma candidum TaxID=119954 RepID=A0ACB9MPW0_9MYRT|nr:hypothetical protein MLD38_031500 [Melastoma candidum]
METRDMSWVTNQYHFARLAELMDEDDPKRDKSMFSCQYRQIYRLACPCDRRIAPTVLLDVPGDSHIMHEEIFEPLLPIVTLEDGIAMANSRPKRLAAYLFTRMTSSSSSLCSTYQQGACSPTTLSSTYVRSSQLFFPYPL